ncbi:hypothetical protein [Peribacillus asahii]|uniref:hypothetical protein n=1 Tax=Peribacillus asahii TaxID=228899 RepID=UPI0037F30A08
MNGIYPLQDKVKIIVFTNCKKESEKYLKLFTLMLKESIKEVRNSDSQKRIITDKFEILFITGNNSSRGHRAHYVMNLTQDKEFDNYVAKPIERFELLEFDPKWSELL